MKLISGYFPELRYAGVARISKMKITKTGIKSPPPGWKIYLHLFSSHALGIFMSIGLYYGKRQRRLYSYTSKING